MINGKTADFLEANLNPGEKWQDFIGGAPRFLEFISTELLPTLCNRYAIATSDVTLAGNSAAGVFAAYTLFSPDKPFQKYMISSPAMAYGDGEIFRREAHWAKANQDLTAQVYMGAGSRELNNIFYESLGLIVSGMSKLNGVLLARNYASLELFSDVYNDTGHIDSLFSNVAEGLRRLHPKQQFLQASFL
ncbi:alpha/beta hydrolase [Exilibacterium tricleocarpae]|uniref:alpha/beta hydrolase n=1 Tax=Exilibacterium tricleocarpae TaxID=2591008 RepID=UPI0015D232DB|nr:alpha/beta hydrolase-fold protein [Exilibacterium tricleocarpae]